MAASPSYNSPELKVFKLHFGKLAESISHPEQLANELYSQDIISKAVRNEALHINGPSPYYRASKLVAAVEDQLVGNPSVLHKFLSVMRRDQSLVYIADSMSDHYHRSLFPPNASVPTLTQLSTELRDFENWYLLGLQLNISKAILDSIEKSHDTNVRQCIEMVQYWIKNSEDPSWETIREALRNIGESVFSAKIAEKYLIQSSSISKELYNTSSEERSTTHVPKLEQSNISEGKSTAAVKMDLITMHEKWRICSYFATVLDRIKKLLKKYVKPKDLVGFLRLHCHPLYPEKLYVDPKILQHVKSVSKVMESLVPDYINYMETGLLEAIVERFECKKAQTLLQQYHDRYPDFRQLRDMPNPIPDERLDQTRREMLRAKCEGHFDNTRAIDVKRIQTSIEGATGIDHRFVTPAQHSEGSFILTFLIPESVRGVFHELCDEDLELLAMAGIVELKFNDFVIGDIQEYCCASSAQDSSSSIAGQSGAIPKGFDAYIEERQFTSKEKAQLYNLLKHVPQSSLVDMCTNSFLHQLSTHMTDWRKLAPYFGISEVGVEKLTYWHPDVGEQRYRALLYWKQINPETATYKNLITCLLANAPFELTRSLLKMLAPDAAVQEVRKLLQEAYLSEKSQSPWTGAPELLQFNRGLCKVTEDTDKQYKDIDYSFQFETLEHFSSEIEAVSIKAFVNEVTKKERRFCLIKGPPGSGRTALLQRVCAFWAQGFCLRKFTLVLWLNLKAHPGAPYAYGVEPKTLLSRILPLGSHVDNVQQWLERHGAQDVLIVMDGVEGQPYDRWLRIIDKVLLNASLIFTAASPIQIEDPHDLFSTHFVDLHQYDLLGLSEDQITKQVIHHYRDDITSAEKFLVYISEALDIRTLCSSPPHLTAVLFVFDVSARNLPKTWTQLFTSLKHSLLSMSDSGIIDNIAIIESHGRGHINPTMKWYQYTTFCSKVTPPYHTVADQCSFTIPLLQQYLYAQYVHSLPHDRHVPALKDKAVPLHVKQFYFGLCNSTKKIKMILNYKDLFMTAACISEVAVERPQWLQVLTSSQLQFKNQWFSPMDIHCVFQAVHKSKQLCKLEFYSCYFGSLTFEMMTEWLRADLCSDGTVQELTLWYMALDKGASYALAGALKVNRNLRELNLGWNQIQDEGVHALARALQMNQCLHSLNLSYNHITDEGAYALAKALQVNQSVQKLNLWNNKIADKGACALAGALQVNQGLQTLYLWENKISDKGACALATALQMNKNLQKLNLRWNHIFKHGKTVLRKAMQMRKTLKIKGLTVQWKDRGCVRCDQHTKQRSRRTITLLQDDHTELLSHTSRHLTELLEIQRQRLTSWSERERRELLSGIQRERRELSSEIQRLTEQISWLERFTSCSERGRRELSSEIQRLTEQISWSERERRELSSEIQRLTAQIRSARLTKRISWSARFTSCFERLTEQISRFERERRELSSEIQRLTEQRSWLERLTSCSERERRELLPKTQRERRELLSEIQRLTAQISWSERLTERISWSERERRELSSEIQRLTEQISWLERLTSCSERERELLSKIQRERRELLSEIQRLTEQISRFESPIERISWSARLTEQISRFERLTEQISRFESDSVHRSSSISFHAQRRSLTKVKLKRKNPPKRGLDLKCRPWQH